MPEFDLSRLSHVRASIGYVATAAGGARYRIYPPSSGRESEAPATETVETVIYNGRPIADRLDIDAMGFELCRFEAPACDYLDGEAVRRIYYPEVEALIKRRTGADHVVVFDHNIRSAQAMETGQAGVREPVRDVHNDYTEKSGEKRIETLLKERGEEHLLERRVALINVWKPIRGPVRDWPLTLCDVRTVKPQDFVEIDIDHFAEDEIARPAYSGQIYSLSYNPSHQWFYMSDMMPDEVFMFKGYDSQRNGVSRFTPHTAFIHPACPPDFIPRESIEARALVVYPEGKA